MKKYPIKTQIELEERLDKEIELFKLKNNLTKQEAVIELIKRGLKKEVK